MASKFGFVKTMSNFEKLKRSLPIEVGNMGQNHFRRSFEQQGFVDKSLVKWKEVKRREPGTDAYKYPKKNAADRHARGIMIGIRTKGSGPHLRDSVAQSNKKSTWNEILFTVPQPYAAVHNYGLRAGRGAGFIMPQRQFIGRSTVLLDAIKQKVNLSISRLHK